MSKEIETDKFVDIERQLSTLQSGVMTYYHLFDVINRNDRFNIGEMTFEICRILQKSLQDNLVAVEVVDDIHETLCELDSCDPHEIPDDCNLQDLFAHIFDLIGKLKIVLGIDDLESDGGEE